MTSEELEEALKNSPWLEEALTQAGAVGWNQCVRVVMDELGQPPMKAKEFKARNPYKPTPEPPPLETPVTSIDMGVPSVLNHRLYKTEFRVGGYDGVQELRKYSNDPALVNTVSSEVAANSGMHTIMLDIDMPAAIVPSSTPGHFHLYIDKRLRWPAYRRLLKALWRAGVIEEGYYKASAKRKHTSLRLPGVKK